MRKFLLLTIVGFATLACNSSNTYTVKGVVEDSVALADAKTAYLQNYTTHDRIDSVEIVDGKFTFKGNADSGVILRVVIGKQRDLGNAAFLVEKGDVTLLFKGQNGSEVTGGPQNQLMSNYNKEMQALSDDVSAKLKALTADMQDEGNEIVMKYTDDMKTLGKKYMAIAEVNTPFKAWIEWQQLRSIFAATVAQIDSVMTVIGPIAQRFEPIIQIRSAKVALESTQAGAMFVDFDALNPDGTAAKLSDYVGKGNYVLVDFWASWCGPCRAEVPAIKEVYKNYKDKGLVVLGVNVWDKKSDYEKSVVELEMPWAQICNFDNNTPTDSYGINGIPHIILFGPDGKIVERGLRGDAMKAKIAEVYSK